MDLNMPIMDGFQATIKIRQMIEDKKIRPLSILGSTADS